MKIEATQRVVDGRLKVHIDLQGDLDSFLIEQVDLQTKGDLPGHAFRGNQWDGGAVEEQSMSPRTKSEIAKASATRVGTEIQRYSEERNEPLLAKALGGRSLKDNEPVDVITTIDGKDHGIELKTMVSNKADKITMKKEAQDRKRQWEKKHPGRCHTVVFDDREVFNAKGPGKHDDSKRRIFYRRGFGSFRVGSMYEVKGGMKELKELLAADKRKLPKGAK